MCSPLKGVEKRSQEGESGFIVEVGVLGVLSQVLNALWKGK
jgi:hypothetical protein